MKVLAAVALLVGFTVVSGQECVNGTYQSTPGVANCTQFNICVHESWWGPYSCNEPTLFNNDTGACSHAYDVDPATCGNVTDSTVVTGCTPGDTRQVNDTGCAQFEICSHGEWFGPLSCAYLTLINIDTGYCDNQANIDNSTCKKISPAQACYSGQYRATPGSNCIHYDRCNHYAWEGPYSCPPGTLFNERGDRCDFAASVNVSTCGSGSVDECSYGSYRATPDANCTQYDMCVHGAWIPQSVCAPGTLFNNDTQGCDHEAAVDVETCGNATSVLGCTAPAMRGVARCTKYQLCTGEGIWAERSDCPSGFLINIDLGYCDFPENVHASNCSAVLTLPPL